MVVGAKGAAEPRQIVASQTVGDKWLVTSGLKAGDQVIVEGLQKVRPGAPVKAGRHHRSSPRCAKAGRRHAFPFLSSTAHLRVGRRDRHHAGRALAIRSLPIAQYPDIALPQVSVSAPSIPAPRPRPSRTASPRSSSRR
jgi:hypothetical protein